jgi:hypothetical protein
MAIRFCEPYPEFLFNYFIKILSFDSNLNHFVVRCRNKKTARGRFLGRLAKSQSTYQIKYMRQVR